MDKAALTLIGKPAKSGMFQGQSGFKLPTHADERALKYPILRQHPSLNPEAAFAWSGGRMGNLEPYLKAASNGIESPANRLIEFAKEKLEPKQVLIRHISSLMNSPPPIPREIVKGIVSEACKIFIAGSSKSRKTFFALMLSFCVSIGMPFLGFETTKSRVLYVNFELSEYSFWKRVKAMAEKLGKPADFDFLQMRGVKNPLKKLVELNLKEYDLVVIDPFYKIMGAANENSANEIGAVLSEIEALTVESGAALLVVHHYAKGSQASKFAIDRLSGSGVFGRDADTLIMLTELEQPGTVSMEFILRDHAPIEAQALTFEYPCWQMAAEGSVDVEAIRDPSKRRRGRPPKWDINNAFHREAALGIIARSMGQHSVLCSELAEALGCSERVANDALGELMANSYIKKNQMGAYEINTQNDIGARIQWRPKETKVLSNEE